MTPPLDPEILRALRVVIDPELGIDVVSLGLVYEAVREGETARVKMTMTTPACPLGESIIADARRAIEDLVSGVGEVDVQLTFEPAWTPERMAPEARAHLGHDDGSRP